MAYNFDRNKYADIFNNMSSIGSFSEVKARAAERGRKAAQVKIAQQLMKQRQEQAEEERKRRERYSKNKEEHYEEQVRRGNLDIDDVPDGKLRSEVARAKMESIERMEGRNADVLTGKEYTGKDDYIGDIEGEIDSTGVLRPTQYRDYGKPEKKKEDKSIFDGLANDFLTPLKNFGQAVNPFDDVSYTEAFKNNVEDALSTDRAPINKEISRALTRADNTATFGLLNNLDKKSGTQHSAFKKRDGAGQVADLIYDLAGYGITGAGVANVLRGVGLGAKANTVGQLAKEGAITGAGIAGTEVGISELMNPDSQNWKQNLTKVGLETLGGGILDPALVKGGGKLIELLKGLRKSSPSNAPEQLLLPEGQSALPEGRTPTPLTSQMKPLNRTQTTPFNALAKLPEPVTQPRPQFEAITPGKDPGLKLSKVADIDQTIGDADTFNSKVNRNPKKENGLTDTLKNLRTQFVDDLAPLERLEKLIKGKVGSAEDSLYKTARLLKGSPERANEIVRAKFTPVLNEVEKLGYTADNLGDYALAVHARDVNAKGLNSGFTDAEIKATIDKFKPLEKAREELIKISDDVLKNELMDSDVISKESYNAMRDKWPNYMPLLRSFDDEKIEFGSGLGKSLANASSPIKKLEGSSRDVIDPLESMVKNIFKATNTADRNRVGKQLAKLSEQDTKGLITKLEPNEKVDRKNVVSVMENGKKVKYEVPPEIYSTIQNLDKESTNTIVKILQKPASMLRAGATLTPEFSLRNPMRDVAQAYVVSKSGFNPIVDFPIGLAEAIMKGRPLKVGGKQIKGTGELYKQFIADNGGYGNIVSMDRELHRKAIQNVMKEGNTKKFVNIVNPKQWLELLRTMADVSETATKLGEYRAALRSGASRPEAAYQARDIMDFARAGTSIREANKVVAFLNANIQGKSKLIRAIKEDPKGVTARAFTAVTLPTIGAFLAQKFMANEQQKTTIDDAPAWLKNTFWLVPIPGTDQVARIPKPFDLAPIFANGVEKFMNYMWDNDPDAFKGYAKESLSSYAVPTMLTGILPLVEGMANYSFFRQGPIIPRREQNIEFPDQYDVNTSETAKFIGKSVDKVTGGQGAFSNFGSPRVIDNAIRGLTGGLGQYVTSAIDLVAEGTGAVNDPEKPDKQINQQPLLRSFLVNQTSTGESVGKLYDTLEQLRRARGSARQEGEDFKREATYDQLNDVTGLISDITGKMRDIENDPNMSGEEKRRRLDELNEKRNKIAREVASDLQRR